MVRRTTSLMTALGIALVVMVVVILLSFVGGLRQSLELAGEPGHWIVLSRGTVSEGESYIPREQSDVLRTRPEIATDAVGRAAVFSRDGGAVQRRDKAAGHSIQAGVIARSVPGGGSESSRDSSWCRADGRRRVATRWRLDRSRRRDFPS